MSSPRFIYLDEAPLTRSPSDRILFCDGTGGESYDPGRDIELSHWLPNETPASLKADSSTEICLNFAAGEALEDFTLVCNNHPDLDGLLSAFALIQPELALDHREQLVTLAEAGDFWSPLPAEMGALYETLILFLTVECAKLPGQELHDRFFGRFSELLLHPDRRSPAGVLGGEQHEASVRFLEQEVERSVQGRLVRYLVPRGAAEKRGAPHHPVLPFGGSLLTPSVFAPHARPAEDDSCVLLVCVESGDGWQYDLWYPGYAWADAPNRWEPPGRTVEGSRVRLEEPRLADALRFLSQQETARGKWSLSERLNLNTGLAERGFPVILAFTNSAGSASSGLLPDAVLETLAPIFAQ